MSHASLSGEHYCEAHQGNYSHYAKHNCLVCQLREALGDCLEAAGNSGSGAYDTARKLLEKTQPDRRGGKDRRTTKGANDESQNRR